MSKKTFCFVSQEYPEETGWGGIGTYTYEMAHGLARRGHQVIVVSRAIGTEKTYVESDGVQVHRILPRWNPNSVPLLWRLNQFWEGYQLAVALKLCEIVKTAKPDVIEAPTLHGETVLFKVLQKRPPIVARIHSCTPLEIEMSGQKWTRSLRTSYEWEKVAFRQADALTSPTHHAARDNAALVKNQSVTVIPNPIDLRRFDSNSAQDESLGVLYVGRLDWRKGIRELIDAMFLVWQECPTLPLTVVGRERGARPGGEGQVSAWLRQRLASAPGGVVKWLDWLSRDRMPQIYAKACVGVFPSHWEPFGYVYVETMASGKPVIGTYAGGPDEIIRHRDTGLLVPPRDSENLAKAILELAQDRELRRMMGRRARQDVAERFDLPIVLEQMETLYASVVTR